jgi:hypothetical protein
LGEGASGSRPDPLPPVFVVLASFVPAIPSGCESRRNVWASHAEADPRCRSPSARDAESWPPSPPDSGGFPADTGEAGVTRRPLPRPFIRPDYLGPIYMIVVVSVVVILIKVLT